MLADRDAGVVYRVPLACYPQYRDHLVIVRSSDPVAIARACPDWDRDRVVGVELERLDADSDALATWGHGVPIELVMRDPARDFPLLYRHTPLLEQHPVWAIVPVMPGFSDAVRLAAALNVAVKLDVAQPAPEVIDELERVADLYLHQSSCAQPIDYFHGVLLALYHRYPTTLWHVLGADPAYVRVVSDDGTCVATPSKLELSSECATCEFRAVCGGYFKWPDPEFDCGGVKAVFRILAHAADDIRSDLAAYAA
jgi:hypothetical protein